MKRAITWLVFTLLLTGCDKGVKTVSATSVEFKSALAQPGLVVVDFYTTWCGPCKTMAPIVAQAEKDYAGKIHVLSIDIDQHQEIAAQYKVEAIPTFIVFKDGKPQDTRLGSMSKKDFTQWLDSFVTAAK